MDAIVAFCGGQKSASNTTGAGDALVAGDVKRYGSTVSEEIDIPTNLPFVTEKKALSSEPASNWSKVSMYLPEEKEVKISNLEAEQQAAKRQQRMSMRKSMGYKRSSILVDLVQHTEPPSKSRDLYELRYNEVSLKGPQCLLYCLLLAYTSNSLFVAAVQQRIGMLPLATILLLYKGKIWQSCMAFTMVHIFRANDFLRSRSPKCRTSHDGVYSLQQDYHWRNSPYHQTYECKSNQA